MRKKARKRSADESFSIGEDTMNEILSEDQEILQDTLKKETKSKFRLAYQEKYIAKGKDTSKSDSLNQSKRSKKSKRLEVSYNSPSKKRTSQSVAYIESDLLIEELTSKKAEQVYLKIKKWRQKNKAVVDTQGAEHHYTPTDPKNEQAFQIMVGVLLSVQSNDVITDRVMKTLLEDGVSIQKYAKLTQKQVQEKIIGINFNKKKSIFIHAAATKILEDFNGTVPSTLKELTSFKGIGPKVAHLILQIAFGKTTGVAVDTHVHRISNRLGFVK